MVWEWPRQKPPYKFIWVMYNIIHKVYKLVQAYRSQEPSSWLLLTSSNLLDSLIPEVYCMNKLLWFEKVPETYAEASVMQVDDILHTKDH